MSGMMHAKRRLEDGAPPEKADHGDIAEVSGVPAVHNRMARVEELAFVLAERIELLESRLDPVLSPAGAADPDDATPRDTAVSPHAERLVGVGDRLERTVAMINTLIDRLEI